LWLKETAPIMAFGADLLALVFLILEIADPYGVNGEDRA